MARITNTGKRKGKTENKLVYTNICVFLYIYKHICFIFSGTLPLHFDFIIKLLCKLSNAHSIKKKKVYTVNCKA